MDATYSIRPARRRELVALPEIERLAATLFAPFDLADLFARDVASVELLDECRQAGRLWVAAGEDDLPVGFAIASELDGNAHLDGINVHPDHGRRRIGTSLVEVVCGWARSAGYDAMTLSTMRDVPWNASFYEKLGFRIIHENEMTEALREVLRAEARAGMPVRDRVLMRRDL
jgi:GNAT superfamily N-acetyltransferase